jgi:hypothetical protein
MQTRLLWSGLLLLTLGCPGAPPLEPTDEICDDNEDNDLDGRIDCADADCAGDSPLCPNSENCDDGIDNDVDGFSDCADSGCANDINCQPENDCTDGIDNDSDNLIDCADADCTSNPSCLPEVDCGDGVDNDQDGLRDCQDSDCAAGCPIFTLTSSTELNAQNGLILHTNIPARVQDCLSVNEAQVPCQDNDLDGLSDAWEDVVLNRFHPIRRFDEDETLVSDPAAALGDVGRVKFAPASSPQDPFRAHVMIMLGYSEDYGSCGGFTSHNGDSERVALNLEQVPGTLGDVQMVQAFTTGHEGTSNDQSTLFDVADFDQLEYETSFDNGEPRWVVFPSADKHATYATVNQCEDVSFIPCLDEDCGPDNVGNPAIFDRLPPVVNAGEETAQLADDLSIVGFPGDDAWLDQEFCGGLSRADGCSSPVRDKLLNDPFGFF